MAPEVLDPEMFGLKRALLTQPSDVYSLGMVMLEIFTERVPFPECRRDAAIMHSVMSGNQPERASLANAKSFSDRAWDVMEACWDMNWEKGPTISAARQRLLDLVQTSETDKP
ncbi:hypothetical protein AcW1_010013 [Taiwanofungus camphoratus]|nr:hypothetical protein AcW1_010013 [Antrodia cinnamomea]